MTNFKKSKIAIVFSYNNLTGHLQPAVATSRSDLGWHGHIFRGMLTPEGVSFEDGDVQAVYFNLHPAWALTTVIVNHGENVFEEVSVDFFPEDFGPGKILKIDAQVAEK